MYHGFKSCISGKETADNICTSHNVHINNTKLRKFHTLTTTQMQCTTMYATAYIQVSNLKIKPSKTKDANEEKKKNGEHGGWSIVQFYQC